MRRKFFDIHHANGSPIAREAIERIGALYVIEKEIHGQPPEVRREVRRARAGPLLDTLKAWRHESLAKLSAKSELATAIRYATSHWPALTRYRDDGTLEIDNNAAERAAAIYSLIGTAKLNGLDPEAYLRPSSSASPSIPPTSSLSSCPGKSLHCSSRASNQRSTNCALRRSLPRSYGYAEGAAAFGRCVKSPSVLPRFPMV